MSNEAINDALEARIKPATTKFVLLVYANAFRNGRAWLSAKLIGEQTGLNRKTILAAIAQLEAMGALIDTGERQGATSSVKVYRIPDEIPEAVPESGLVPKTEQHRKRRRASPKTDASCPEIAEKLSQNRATDPYVNPTEPNGTLFASSTSGSTPTPLLPPRLNGAEAIPLVGGVEWHCPPALLTELDRLYPAVDPVQTFREIRAWCITNPGKRKTTRGVERFVNRWFAQEQDRHGRT